MPPPSYVPPPYTPDDPPEPWWTPSNLAYLFRHVWPLVLVGGTLLAVAGVFAYDALRPEPAASPSMPAASSEPPATSPAEVSGTASVLVTSEPAGATLLVRGDSVGATPFLLDRLDEGRYLLSLRLSGHVQADTLVAVGRGATQTVRVRLRPEQPARAEAALLPEPAPPPLALSPPPAPPPAAPPPATPPPATPPPVRTGTVEVTVRPWGTIAINGEVVRRDTDVTHAAELPAGMHQVRVTHPVLGEQTRSVRVQPGQTLRLSFNLNDGSAGP
ncbi:MAG: PEGA domain-containing protein [Rubricoccaceae bacterium]